MSKEQLKWDMLLMRGWKLDKSMGWVVFNFYGQTIGNDLEWKIENLSALEIKRCFERVDNSERMLILFKKPVRAFVDEYCKKLSDILWGDDSIPAEYSMCLDDFSWSNGEKSKTYINRKRRMTNARREVASTRCLPMMGGHVGTTQWNKVK